MCVMLQTIEEFITSVLDVHVAGTTACWTPDAITRLLHRCTGGCECTTSICKHGIRPGAPAVELQMIVYLIMRNARYGKFINIATVLSDAATCTTAQAHVRYTHRQVYHGGYHLSGLMRLLVTQRLPLVNVFFRASRQAAMHRDFRELAIHASNCDVAYCETQRGIVPWSCSQLGRFRSAIMTCRQCSATTVCDMHCNQCRLLLGVDAPVAFVNTVAFSRCKQDHTDGLHPKRIRT